jgi:hypothetical protein
VARSRIPVSRPIPRRPVLVGLTAAIAFPAVAGSVAACAEKAPDPLIALVNQARSDAALLDVAARAWQNPPAGQPDRPTGPITANLLSAVGDARRVHADKMAAELGDDAPPPPPAGQPAPAAQEPKAALAGVLTALAAAQRSAAELVPGLSRHQAALVGSIAACCGAYESVLL